MGLYLDKLAEMMPVQQSFFKRDIGGEISHYVSCHSNGKNSRFTREWEKIKVSYEGLGNIEGKRVFLITDEQYIGVKVADSILNTTLYGELEESDEYGRYVKEERKKGILQRELEDTRKLQLIDADDYAGLYQNGMLEAARYYFTGLTEMDGAAITFDEKVKCILSCPAKFQFIQLKEEQVNSPWARLLMRNREFELIHLPKRKADYYVAVMKELLEGERYKLEAGLEPEEVVQVLKNKDGKYFSEEALAWSLDMAVRSAQDKGEMHYLARKDLGMEEDRESTLQKLNKLTGLRNMKTMAREMAAFVKEQRRNPRLRDICWHMIFKGNPGTGKTMCAKMVSKIRGECGQGNGVFISATRKDIIGEHVGQTAPQIAGLFDKARNGVLFVDEAGFLLHDQRASYNQEAIKEFVRYMELYQDVTVIFALYPREVEEWLGLDAGLSSRISRIVDFEDFEEEELVKIAGDMCQDRGYRIEEDVQEKIQEYCNMRKKLLGEKFGNAREMRKLVEGAIIARSIRCYDEAAKEGENLLLKTVDFEQGINKLLLEQEKKSSPIGFFVVADDRREQDGTNKDAC